MVGFIMVVVVMWSKVEVVSPKYLFTPSYSTTMTSKYQQTLYFITTTLLI